MSATSIAGAYLRASLPKEDGGDGFNGSLQNFLTRNFEAARFQELWDSLLVLFDSHPRDSPWSSYAARELQRLQLKRYGGAHAWLTFGQPRLDR